MKLLRLRHRHPEREVDDLRRQSDQRELAWDSELADEQGQAWHDWGDADDDDTIDVTDTATGTPRRLGPRHRRRR